MSRKSYKNFIDGNYLRSYREFVFYMYLTRVKGLTVKSEIKAFKFKSHKKIPDLFVYDNNGKISEIIEIKPVLDETVEVIVDYCNNADIVKDYRIKFVTVSKQNMKIFIKDIIDKIGLKSWENFSQDFKSNGLAANTHSFPGEMNGMYGKMHSRETRKLISKNCGRPGRLNGMYGKNHKDDSRELISSRSCWKNMDKSNKAKIKGFITHISKFESKQYDEFLNYAIDRYNDVYHKKPEFLNNAYCVNKEKIDLLFGNLSLFLSSIKQGG